MLHTIDPEILENTIATLATTGSDGGPEMTAIWYLVEDDRILISATARRRKTKNLASHPHCSVLVFHPSSVNYYAEIRGVAELIEDPAYEISDRIAVRYDADFRTFDGPNDRRLIIAVTPERVLITDVR